MCKDCGCTIAGMEHNHSHHHHEHNHSHHNHGNRTIFKPINDNLKSNPLLNDVKTISIIQKILDKNDHEASHNRVHFDNHKVLGINLMSSPGSGKTTFLEKLSEICNFKFAVVEGDLETSKDADRLKAKGINAIQIQTGSACHLDAFMVHKALHDIDLDEIDVCFIENVGNLVCPASYDVGTHLNIVLVSIPEGEDKIIKYPVMFRSADLILFTKTDLLPYFEYDIEKEKQEARKLKPNVDILEVNIKDKESLQNVIDWINFKRKMR
ncbi:hydrogenase accessory protein HypB [Aliarcobacter trophiarum LMG 25534]|uniref:Hydrogenase accessory protein HypB n=1 Tax=Aliarcobacter trophiarum LMG 25534 TaxID=1032241 RepID=A0AAD0VMS7_9BACT|nr:hydrogenase nickel incorporation protein HypB [Aliarcobacter trophiarum]AXK49728.1 hydrogenase nickel insertion protein HypB [Aliarcobacter trophiarum LMG 25534]RXI28051.1 hydrogenase accessory protein HypB [Aliarcobacter trophiarum]RXJ92495.1 hydrogenase accessory protein HypB [Aliarcobacter trophiarum LMG 25534]